MGHRQLSTTEKNELANDPAVRDVMTLFGGEVADMRHEAPAVLPNDESVVDSEDQ